MVMQVYGIMAWHIGCLLHATYVDDLFQEVQFGSTGDFDDQTPGPGATHRPAQSSWRC